MGKKQLVVLLSNIVVSISVFGILLNVIHFFEIRNKEEIHLGEDSILVVLKESLERSEEVVKTLEETPNNGSLKSEDYNILIRNVNECFANLKSLSILNYEGGIKFDDRDKYEILVNTIDGACPVQIVESFKIMEFNDEKLFGISDMITSQIYLGMISREPINANLIENYNYRLKDYFSYGIAKPENIDLYIIIGYSNSQAKALEFIANWLLERTGE